MLESDIYVAKYEFSLGDHCMSLIPCSKLPYLSNSPLSLYVVHNCMQCVNGAGACKCFMQVFAEHAKKWVHVTPLMIE